MLQMLLEAMTMILGRKIKLICKAQINISNSGVHRQSLYVRIDLVIYLKLRNKNMSFRA